MIKTEKRFTSIITMANQRYEVKRNDFYLNNGSVNLFVRELTPFRMISNHYVVFVHGLTFPSISDFDLQIKGHSITHYLAERGVNSCFFDFRGYGNSDKTKKVTYSDRISDLRRIYQYLKEEKGIEQISFVGLSSGCNIVVDFLREEHVTPYSLTLLGACYLRNDFVSRNIEKLQLYKIFQFLKGEWGSPYVLFNRKQLKKRLVHGEEKFLDKAAALMFIEKAMGSNDLLNGKLEAPILPFFDQCKKADYMDALFPVDHLKAPTLVVRGENDEICCRKSGVSLYNALARSGVPTEIYTHENSKHDIHLYRNAEELFSRVYAFLTKRVEA